MLGEGSFGRVWLSRHRATGHLVALKHVRVKRPEDGLPRVLVRELLAMERLACEGIAGRSSHVVRLLYHFAHKSSVVLVMEAMMTDLAKVMRQRSERGQRMRKEEVRECMRQVMSGVEGIHKQQVMHRVRGRGERKGGRQMEGA